MDLETLDAKIAEQQERLEERPEAVSQVDPDTYVAKMKEAFEEMINNGIKCSSCKHMIVGQKLLMVYHFNVMREHIPTPIVICPSCGNLFVPKWAMKVVKRAVEEENIILKRRQKDAQKMR